MVPDALTLAGALYKMLRTMKSRRFNPDNYFWKIGQLTFAEMARDRVTLFREAPEEATLLYGIRVEVDYNNDFGLRLFEDITDTIGEPPKEKKVDAKVPGAAEKLRLAQVAATINGMAEEEKEKLKEELKT